MGNLEHALSAYENALRHNPMSLSGLTQVAGIARIKENYPKVRLILPPISDPPPLPARGSRSKLGATCLFRFLPITPIPISRALSSSLDQAVEYFQRVLNMQQDNGEVWSALGKCHAPL